MSERIVDKVERRRLSAICDAAISLARQRHDHGKIPFIADIQTFLRTGTATVKQGERVVALLAELKAKPAMEMKHAEAGKRGAETNRARHAFVRMPTFSFSKDDAA